MKITLKLEKRVTVKNLCLTGPKHDFSVNKTFYLTAKSTICSFTFSSFNILFSVATNTHSDTRNSKETQQSCRTCPSPLLCPVTEPRHRELRPAGPRAGEGPPGAGGAPRAFCGSTAGETEANGASPAGGPGRLRLRNRSGPALPGNCRALPAASGRRLRLLKGLRKLRLLPSGRTPPSRHFRPLRAAPCLCERAPAPAQPCQPGRAQARSRAPPRGRSGPPCSAEKGPWQAAAPRSRLT